VTDSHRRLAGAICHGNAAARIGVRVLRIALEIADDHTEPAANDEKLQGFELWVVGRCAGHTVYPVLRTCLAKGSLDDQCTHAGGTLS